MAVITLGSRNTSEVGRVSPIEIPVEALPIPGILVLTNPLIIREFANTVEIDSLWIKNSTYNYLRPGTSSDKVVIGGNALYGSEQLNVFGTIHSLGLTISNNSSILVAGSDLVFTDGNTSATLSQLVNNSQAITASDVIVTTPSDYYNGSNVQEVLDEISYNITLYQHSHSNKDLLDTLGGLTGDDYTNEDIQDAIDNSHDILTLGELNGLSLVGQELSLAVADTDNTGALTSDDWDTFNSKLDTTDTLDAVKDLILSQGGLIIGTSDTGAEILPMGASEQVLTVKSDLSGLEWADATGSGNTGMFEVPDGFTEISNEIGDITNTNYTPVTNLNGLTILEVLQDMLFPSPNNPNFVNPTTSITITPSDLSPATMFNVLYVENGSSADIAISSSLSSGNGPGGKPYGLANGSPSYTKNGVAFTTGTSVVFTANQTFAVSYPYKPNGILEIDPEFVELSNGSTVYADEYTGANSGNATSSETYTVVDPIYYGNMTGSIGSYPTLPTDAELIVGSTKLVSTEPSSVSSLSITVASYNSPSAVDNTKYIVVYYPKSYGVLSDIKYVQNSNQSVKNTFTGPTDVSHIRPDTNDVDYYVYFAANPYNNSEIVTYTIHF